MELSAVYSLLVSHQFQDWDEGTVRFDRSRFLEYTSESIGQQLQLLSVEAIDCIKSWPCVLMNEGRGEGLVRIARILDLNPGRDIQVKFSLCPSTAPILNDDIWRSRDELDIEQFEFSRSHWAIKERDLFSVLGEAGHEFKTSDISLFEKKPLPAPTRASLLAAKDVISEWSHAQIDNMLLEAGVPGLSAGRDLGGRRDRANAIVRFAIDNPAAMTAERSLFSAYLMKRVSATRSDVAIKTWPTLNEGAEAGSSASDTNSSGRSPNRVFVVHGQNETARTAVVSFLKGLGLVGIVLHDQPNMGRHLLTKFIEEAELVTFAVILMTDDDVGSAKGGGLRPRARQNVILELGYFLAHLGQAKVCALITPGLETPSDFDGIVYIRMDDEGGWKKELKRELVAAQMPVI